MASFSPRRLLAALAQIPTPQRYWIAYSGGLDSHVLLHALALLREQLSIELHAVHINHQLMEEAAAWVDHCTQVCAGLQIPLQTFKVDATPRDGEGPEAAARNARYGRLAGLIEEGDCLLTAHHQDDQAETVLLQLLRGAGPAGLAAMPLVNDFSNGLLARPLLSFDRQQLVAYAREQGLQWIDDPSNFDTGYERNFIRHQVLPQIRTHWPAAATTLARSAHHHAEASTLLNELAAADLAEVVGETAETLVLDRLNQLSPKRQRNLFRHWLKGIGLPLPTTVQLEHLQHDLLTAAEDREPLIHWPGVDIRRYRNTLYALRPEGRWGDDLAPQQDMSWDLNAPLVLPAGLGVLHALPEKDCGLKIRPGQQVTVGFRRGGERCRPAGNQHHRPLKKLFQERGIPPWRRQRIPLVFIDGELAAVADLWFCDPFVCMPGEGGIGLHWEQNTKSPADN